MDKQSLQTLLVKHKSKIVVEQKKVSLVRDKADEIRIRQELKDNDFPLGQELLDQVIKLFKDEIEKNTNFYKYEVFIKLPKSISKQTNISLPLKNILIKDSNCEVDIVFKNYEMNARFQMTVP